MTESEVRKLLRQMKELDSQTAFRDFYNMTYDRLFRIAYYYVKQEEWSQEIVLDIFLKLWKQRDTLLDVKNIEDLLFYSGQERFSQLSGKRIKVHHHSFRFFAGTTGTKLFSGRVINQRRIVCNLCESARPASGTLSGSIYPYS